MAKLVVSGSEIKVLKTDIIRAVQQNFDFALTPYSILDHFRVSSVWKWKVAPSLCEWRRAM